MEYMTTVETNVKNYQEYTSKYFNITYRDITRTPKIQW